MENQEEDLNHLKDKIEVLKKKLKIGEKKRRTEEIKDMMKKKDFWDKAEAPKLQKELSEISEDIEMLKSLNEKLKDLTELSRLGEAVEEEAEQLKKEVKESERKVFLSGKYDDCSAIFTISAGAGGRESEDWAAMLFKMYEKWAEKKGYNFYVLYRKFSEGGGPEGRIGVKECSFKIKGRFAYGLLKKETGTHRLVRISPFSSKGLRHTSFCLVEVTPEIKDDFTIKINPENLKVETFRASGPGGQYVNRRESAVRITHISTGIRAESQSERLQGKNKKNALDVLMSKLAAKKEREREEEIKKIKGESQTADFGSQIRSYVLEPYQLVKDLRTGAERANPSAVLEGDLDLFIEKGIMLN